MKTLKLKKIKEGTHLAAIFPNFTLGEFAMDCPFIAWDDSIKNKPQCRPLNDGDFEITSEYRGYLSQGKENLAGQNSVDHLSFNGDLYAMPDVGGPYKILDSKYQGYWEPTHVYSRVYYSEKGSRVVIAYRADAPTEWSGHYAKLGGDAFANYYWERKRYYRCTTRISNISYSSLRKAKYGEEYYLDCCVTRFTETLEKGDWTMTSPPKTEKTQCIVLPIGRAKASSTDDVLNYSAYRELLGFVPSLPEDIATDLLDNLKYKPNINNWENLSGLEELRRLVPDVIKLLKGKVDLDSLSEAHLLYTYGINTLKMDVVEACDHYLKSRPKSHASASVNRKIDGWSIRASISGASNPYSILDELGLSLNLTNAWDIVPWSFVIDWFTNIGDILESIDAASTIRQTKIEAFTVSYSRAKLVSLPDYTGYGEVKKFVRSVSGSIPHHVLSFSLKQPRLKHFFTGGALLKTRGN